MDTIVVIDTIVIDNYDTTIINNIIRQDSVTIINNERIKIKYYYDTITERLEHFISLPSDTIIKEKKILVEKIVIKELTWWQKYGTLIIIIFVLLLGLIVLKKLGKIFI